MNFKEELKTKVEETEAVIAQFLPKEEGFSKHMKEAMNYSMNAGGKRLRPIMLFEAYKMFGGTNAVVQPFMAAIEMIHTQSLVHDDLPAIDGDEYRRGKQTTHAVYGEAVGVLCGDALLNFAYETAMKSFSYPDSSKRNVHAIFVLARKTGVDGMLGGQSVDVENEKGGNLTIEKPMLDYIYLHKTSALLEASLMIGAILAGADRGAIACMEQIGRKIGLAFQICDDILDVTSTTEMLGKPVFSDEKNQKTTYVTLMGVDRAKEEVKRLTEEALRLLDTLEGDKVFLAELISYLAYRDK